MGYQGNKHFPNLVSESHGAHVRNSDFYRFYVYIGSESSFQVVLNPGCTNEALWGFLKLKISPNQRNFD